MPARYTPMLYPLTLCAVALGCTPRITPVSTGWGSSIPPRLSPSLSVVRDLDDLHRVGTTAAIDFGREQVVVLQAPTQHTRSRIAVRRVAVDQGIASIDACVRGSVVQTLSAPWVAVAVPAAVNEVRWSCGGSIQATLRAAP